jgi:Helitron helicase-like domain at N-terminus
VIHGSQPIPDLPGANKSFDALAAAYPVQWPYGRGLFHEEQLRKLSFVEYIHWTLRYHDKQFRTHHSFSFVAFSIQQKQSTLLSAKVHMHQQDFEADSELLAELRVWDLQQAQVDEDAHWPIQNEAVKSLWRHLYATSSHIMGSSQMRMTYWSQIWGTCLWLRPLSLWLTINPMDYEDPIAQILAGECINMDFFMSLLGPNANEWATNIARDPFASASFFNFTIRTTLETLFGIHITPQQIESHMGILEFVNRYFGVIEAQGRGSLHVHMLLWLKHAPNADQMLELLMQPEFHEKVAKYVEFNIRTHLDNFNEEYVAKSERTKHISYSRPPNPEGNQWKTEMREMERNLARTHQVHICKPSTCLCKNSHRDIVCKRQAPWPLIEKTVVHATGMLDQRRTYQFLNGYSPAVLVCLRCNNDLKVVIFGVKTKHIGGYLTNYQNKDPSKSYNMSAMLGSALEYHKSHPPKMESLRERNRMLIYWCFNVLNRQAELSGPQVISYLMNWGDHFISHKYVPVYWGQLANALRLVFPDLGRSRAASMFRKINESTTDKDENDVSIIDIWWSHCHFLNDFNRISRMKP